MYSIVDSMVTVLVLVVKHCLHPFWQTPVMVLHLAIVQT